MKKHLAALPLLLAVCPAFGSDIAEKISQTSSFKTFAAALRTTALLTTLKQPGPYTVFVPSDEAFAKLPRGAWSELAQDKVRLAKILAHHVVPGKIVIAEVKPGDMPTLQGKPVHLSSDNGIVSIDEAKITQSDILADNGVIHEIDTLVLPPPDD